MLIHSTGVINGKTELYPVVARLGAVVCYLKVNGCVLKAATKVGPTIM